VSEIKDVLKPAAPIIAKTRFSMITPEVQTFLDSNTAIRQVMLVGIEVHVCVLQTTLDLLGQGYEVHLVVDAVSSQKLLDRGIGLQRAVQSGAFLTSQEMVMFQLAGDAKHPSFKEISGLAKEVRPDAINLLQAPSML
jgi:nicotinamidase-related amidase